METAAITDAPEQYFTGQGVELLPPPDPPAVPSPPTPPAGAYQVDTSTKGAQPENTAAVRELVLAPQPKSLRTDDFNRADGALGSNWTRQMGSGGDLLIATNQVKASVSDQHCLAFWNADSFGDNQYAEVKITNQIDAWTGVILRADNVNDRCYLGFLFRGVTSGSHGGSFDGPMIHVRWDGVYTELAAVTDATWALGDVLGLKVTGSAHPITLTLYKNGVSVLTWTSPDATFVRKGGAPGIGIYAPAGKNLRLDDWKGGYLGTRSSLIVSDNFNRADAASLGANWTAPTFNEAALKVTGNRCGVTTENKFNNAFWSADTFTDNQWAAFRWSDSGSSNNFSGVILRADAVVDKWFACLVSPNKNNYCIYVRWLGTFLQLATGATGGMLTGDIVKGEITGTTHPFTINMYRNGVLKLTWTSTDSTYVKTGGKPGITIFSPTGENLTLDDWQGGNL